MPENDITTDPAAQAAPEDTAPPTTTEDTDAPEAEESGLDPKAQEALSKVRREAANLRKRIKDLEPAAKKLKELEDKDKSETQRLTDQLTEMQKQIAKHEARELRISAATAAGLPADMAEFITATDPDEAKAQAKKLKEFGKAAPADLRQGARQNPAQMTGDQAIRRMAGRQ